MNSLSINGFADARGVHAQTVRNWVRRGRIRAWKTPGGHWRIPEDQAAPTDGSLSAGEVAKIMDVHPFTVRRWCQAGKIACTRYGRSWRVPREELERICSSGEEAGL
jgi:excisionase family DNA binding protein